MIEQILLDGSVEKIYSKKEWLHMFADHCQKILDERGEYTGEYCCGYHWCCDKCKCELCEGCLDCAATMYEIYESFGHTVDRSNLDFDKFEERAKELYESNLN